MSRQILGVALAAGSVRQVPKFGMTLAEVEFAIGSPDVVRELRANGTLVPVRANASSRSLLFAATDVARAWATYEKGARK
jgi:hypothetical protein